MVVKKPSPKQKQGRPPSFDSDFMKIIAGLFPEQRTQRGLLDKAYLVHAFKILREDGIEKYRWLVEKRMQQTVLTELGKLGDKQAIISLAWNICKHQLNGKDAVKYIRHCRGMKQVAGNYDDLLARLVKTLDDYLAAHTIAKDEVMKAIEVLTLVVHNWAKQQFHEESS